MSIINLNSNIICSVEILTTGSIPFYNDIIGVCFLPIDADLKIRRDIIPFYVEMQPRRPHNIDPDRLKIGREAYARLLVKSPEADVVADLFGDWYKKFRLKENKGIIPLVYDWGAKRDFLIDWLTPLNYKYHIVEKPRDILSVALYENDRAEHNVETIPYAKTNFTYIAGCLNVEYTRLRFDTLDRCIAQAECYRRMLKHSIFTKGIYDSTVEKCQSIDETRTTLLESQTRDGGSDRNRSSTDSPKL